MLNQLNALGRKTWETKLTEITTLTSNLEYTIKVKNPNFWYQHHWGCTGFGEHYYTFVICNVPLVEDIISASSGNDFLLPSIIGNIEKANSRFHHLLGGYGFSCHYQLITVSVDHSGSIDSADAVIDGVHGWEEGNAPPKKNSGYEYVPYGFAPSPSLKKTLEDIKKVQMVSEVQIKKSPSPSNRMKGLLTLIAEKINHAGLAVGAHLHKNWATNISTPDGLDIRQYVFDRIKQLKYSQGLQDESGVPFEEGKFSHVIEAYWKEPMLNTNLEMVKAILYHPQYQSIKERVQGTKKFSPPYWRPLYNYKKDEVVEALKLMSKKFEFEFKEDQ